MAGCNINTSVFTVLNRCTTDFAMRDLMIRATVATVSHKLVERAYVACDSKKLTGASKQLLIQAGQCGCLSYHPLHTHCAVANVRASICTHQYTSSDCSNACMPLQES